MPFELSAEPSAGEPVFRSRLSTLDSIMRCRLLYSTKYRDPDLELHYYGYRWYDAASLKWLAPDPIGERGGFNLTAFCSADPINQVDPLGLEEFELVGLVPRTFDATDVLKQYLPGLDHTIGFRIDPQANAGRGALYVFLPSAYLAPGVLREEAARGDPGFYREATEEEYAWFFLALWEQNIRENAKLTADLQAVVGLGYQADPRAFATDLGRIWRAYHRGETSKLIVKDAGQRLVFSALFAGTGYGVRKAKDVGTKPITDPAHLLAAGKADPLHHVFPQRADLAAEFRKRGIDIDKFSMQLLRDLHVDIHRGAPRGVQWNKAWEDFFRTNPNATDVDVYKHAGKLIYDFELPGGAVVPYAR